MSEIKGLWWGEAILLGGHVQNLDWFVGSFSDKGALHVPKGGEGGGGHFNKFHESGTKQY